MLIRLATIEATLKKVDDLFDEYDVIMGKVCTAVIHLPSSFNPRIRRP